MRPGQTPLMVGCCAVVLGHRARRGSRAHPVREHARGLARADRGIARQQREVGSAPRSVDPNGRLSGVRGSRRCIGTVLVLHWYYIGVVVKVWLYLSGAARVLDISASEVAVQ